MSYSQEQLLGMLDGAIKGLTTVSTLGSTILEPQQFDRYVRMLQKKAVLLPRVRMQVMDAPIVDIDRIAFTTRVMGPPAAEGTGKSTSDYVAPTFVEHQLEACEMQGVVGVTDKMLRRNPERQALMNTILDLMAERTGLDIEEQGINGDTDSGDTFLALNDGWLAKTRRRCPEDAAKAYDDLTTPSFSTISAQTTAIVYYPMLPILEGTFELWEVETDSSHGTLVADEDGDGVLDEVASSGVGGTIDYESGMIVLTGLTPSTDYAVKYTANAFDNTDSNYPENAFDQAIRVLPKQNFRTPSEWLLCVPWHVLKAYRDRLKARESSLGDQYQQGAGDSAPYEGITILYVPNMPQNRLWLTHPDNTVYGIFHEVQMETERQAVAKRTDIIVNAETDYGFEDPEASVVVELS